MFSSQSSSQPNSSFRQYAGNNLLRLPSNDSGFGTTRSQSSMNLRTESGSMSTASSQEPPAYNLRCNSQESPSRRLVQLYTSKEPLFGAKTCSRNVRTISNFAINELAPKEHTAESLAVLTFLVKDLVEKFGTIKDVVDKLAKAEFFKDFLFEIHSQLKEIDRRFSEKLGVRDNHLSKISELEALVCEKTGIIEKLEAEIEVLRRRPTPETAFDGGSHVTAIVAALDLRLTTYLDRTSVEQKFRLSQLDKKLQVLLDENTKKLQSILPSTKVDSGYISPTPSKQKSLVSSTPRQNFGNSTQNSAAPRSRVGSSSSLAKPTLNFIYEVNPRTQQTITSPASKLPRRDVASPQNVPRIPHSQPVKTVPSFIRSTRSRPKCFLRPSPQFAHNSRQTDDSAGLAADATDTSDAVFILDDTSSSRSSSSPEIIMEFLATKRFQQTGNLSMDYDLFPHEDLMTDHMEKMVIEKNSEE